MSVLAERQTSAAYLKFLNCRRQTLPGTSNRKNGTGIDKFTSAVNLKFLSVLRQFLHRNFKFQTALEAYSFASAPLTPKFAKGVAEMDGELRKVDPGEGGFTLIETLVALALMGLVLSALANLTAQWLPNWNRGLDRIQRSEMIGITLQRIAEDLAAAEYVPANRDAKQPLFVGSAQSVTFVRTAFGPNAGPGLDVVRLSEVTDQGGLVTVRVRAPFRPLALESSISGQLHFAEPVLLLRAPYRLSFAYAGEDGAWQSSWRESDKLPAMIRLTVSDASGDRVRAISTVASIHVQSSAQGDCKQPDGKCDGNTGASSAPQGGAQQPGSSAGQGNSQ